MESYVSFNDLLLHHASPVILVFVPIFLATTALEGLLILYRQGTYPWKNAGVSTVMAVGHFLTQAAAHGLIFGIIAASVYRIKSRRSRSRCITGSA